MERKEKLDPGGIRHDSVSYYAADATQLNSFVDARQSLSRLAAPVFVHAGSRHEYLFVASFDGTGKDKVKDPADKTNVGRIDDQIQALKHVAGARIGGDYVAGPGTEDSQVARLLDGAQGFTYDGRVEEMYKKLAVQVWKWKQVDPEADVRVAAIGFSRGGEQAAGFERVVHERGVQNPEAATYTFNASGLISHATYTRPPLIEPGQVAQAVAMFDPVGTGAPMRDYDRRLPPSVISGFQVIAADERRSLFKSDHIIDPGMTADGRFLGVAVAGAHCDIGGCYNRNGLGARSGNLVVDYLNALSDQPYLTREPEPDDPRLNVVHRSENGTLLYRVLPKVNRANPNGYNELLVPARDASVVPDPFNAEPRDEVLNARFERQYVAVERPEPARADAVAIARDDWRIGLDRLLQADRRDDWSAFGRTNESLAFGAAGVAMWRRAEAEASLLERQALQQAMQQQAMQQHQAVQLDAPVMQ